MPLALSKGHGTTFAINYFSAITGFVDTDAARTFIDIVEKHSQILASDKVFDNTYEKLLNDPLKARYTIARKRNDFK